MKKFLALLLTLATVFSLAACGAAPAAEPAAKGDEPAPAAEPAKDEIINIRVFCRLSDENGQQEWAEVDRKMAEFYPNVKIEYVEMPADGGAMLKTMAATGDLCDIFELKAGNTVIESLVESGAIIDMAPALEKTGILDHVYPAEKGRVWYKDGGVYTLPLDGSDTGVLFANKDVFAQYGVEIPKTLDELVEAAKVFTANGMVTIPLFSKETWIGSAFYNGIVSRWIPEGLTGLQEGTTSIRDEAYLKAAQYMQKLAEAGAFGSSPTSMAYENCTELWYNDQSAMFWNGAWECDATERKLGDKVIMIQFPSSSEDRIEEEAKHAIGGKGSCQGLCVAADSPYYDLCTELAAKFIEWIVTYDYVYRQKASFTFDYAEGLTREVPGSRILDELAAIKPTWTSVNDLSGSGDNAELQTVIGENMQAVIAGVMTAEEFIEAVAAVTGE